MQPSTPEKVTNVPSLPHEPVITDKDTGNGVGGTTPEGEKKVVHQGNKVFFGGLMVREYKKPMTPTPEGVNEVLEAIRIVCNLRQFPELVDDIDFSEKVHLEHLIQAIPNFKERWGNDDELFKLFGGYRMSFDYTKSVEDNLRSNPELLRFCHGLLVTK